MFELLVVITIIALLAAVLLPALALAKMKARRVQCLGNLHQLGVGLQVILANDHSYPLLFGGTNGDGSWIGQLAIEGLGMTQPLTNYIRTGVWRCPAAQWLKADENALPISYGYNAYGVEPREDAPEYFGLCLDPGMQTPLKDSQVANPAEVIAIGDVFRARPALTRNPAYGSTWFAYQRHQGRGNMVFCDGHAEPLKLKYLFINSSDAALSRWNRDHQPHRDKL